MTNNILRIKKVYGYSSAVELIGVLVVFLFLILYSNKFLEDERQSRLTNQFVDQAKSFSGEAVRYIEDNYRVLLQTSLSQTDNVIPYGTLDDYSTSGDLSQTNNLQTPCLYVTNGGNNTLRAYIIFGATNSNIKKLDKKTIGKIAQGIGGNAGDLVNNKGSYVISGYSENELTLSQTTINNIISQCGFISPLPSDSLIINLSKNINLFAPIVGGIDSNSTFNDADPSLKKNSGDSRLNTMQTNIYLDNVVKESNLHTEYYCDVGQLPLVDSETTCQNTANTEGIYMYADTASWVSSIMGDDGNCIATAQAHFYSITQQITCNGVNFPDASSFCPQTYNGEPQVTGSGTWSPLPGTLNNNNQCVSTANINYQSYLCSPIDDTSGTAVYAVTGYHVQDSSYYSKCGYGQYIKGSSATGSYNYSTNKCDYIIKCAPGGSQADAWTDNDGIAISNGSITHVSCGSDAVPAKQSTQTNDLGYKNC